MTAKRVDGNQNEIVKEFRDNGFSVLLMSNLGKGAPDIAVGIKGMTFFFEIKDGSKPQSQRKLTKKEIEFSGNWLGHYAIITSSQDVKKFVSDLLS